MIPVKYWPNYITDWVIISDNRMELSNDTPAIRENYHIPLTTSAIAAQMQIHGHFCCTLKLHKVKLKSLHRSRVNSVMIGGL